MASNLLGKARRPSWLAAKVAAAAPKKRRRSRSGILVISMRGSRSIPNKRWSSDSLASYFSHTRSPAPTRPRRAGAARRAASVAYRLCEPPLQSARSVSARQEGKGCSRRKSCNELAHLRSTFDDSLDASIGCEHIVSDDYFFCDNFGAMKGTRAAEDPATADSGKATWPKEKLMTRLRESFTFCDQAIAQLGVSWVTDRFTSRSTTPPERRAVSIAARRRQR